MSPREIYISEKLLVEEMDSPGYVEDVALAVSCCATEPTSPSKGRFREEESNEPVILRLKGGSSSSTYITSESSGNAPASRQSVASNSNANVDSTSSSFVPSSSDANVASRASVASSSRANVASSSRANMPSSSRANVASTSRANMPSSSRANVASRSRANMPSSSRANVASRSRANMPSSSRANMPSSSRANVASRSRASNMNAASVSRARSANVDPASRSFDPEAPENSEVSEGTSEGTNEEVYEDPNEELNEEQPDEIYDEVDNHIINVNMQMVDDVAPPSPPSSYTDFLRDVILKLVTMVNKYRDRLLQLGVENPDEEEQVVTDDNEPAFMINLNVPKKGGGSVCDPPEDYDDLLVRLAQQIMNPQVMTMPSGNGQFGPGGQDAVQSAFSTVIQCNPAYGSEFGTIADVSSYQDFYQGAGQAYGGC